MMILAWHRGSRNPYAVLYYTALPAKGEGEPDSRNRILQHHELTRSEEFETDMLPNGVSRLDYLAEKFPYIPPTIVDKPVDTRDLADMLAPAIDVAVDAYRRRVRSQDGQSAHIDKEWNKS